MHDLTTTALPFFDSHGHPAGLRQLCQDEIAASPATQVNPHHLRCLAATEVILGNYTDAAATYSRLAAATAGDAVPWVQDIAEEAHVRSRLLQHDPSVVHEALTATIDQQLKYLGLPSTA